MNSRSYVHTQGKVVFPVYRAAAAAIQVLFYGFYLAKFFVQKKQQIRTNQMGRGNKPKKVLLVERIMSVATVLALLVSVGSIFLAGNQPLPLLAAAGFLCGIAAVGIFAAATLTMKTSWRVGIPEEKTALITEGIYSVSRNPAFVGFDLLYLSSCLLFPSLPMVLCAVFAAGMLHWQILQEEEYLLGVFGTAYAGYMRRVCRYLGRRG